MHLRTRLVCSEIIKKTSENVHDIFLQDFQRFMYWKLGKITLPAGMSFSKGNGNRAWSQVIIKISKVKMSIFLYNFNVYVEAPIILKRKKKTLYTILPINYTLHLWCQMWGPEKVVEYTQSSSCAGEHSSLEPHLLLLYSSPLQTV